MVFSVRPMRTVFWIALLLGLPFSAWAQQHFSNCLSNTADDATVLVPSDATVDLGTGDSLSTGDEIALYSDDGKCVGVAVWDSSKTAVSIAVADRDSTAEITTGYETDEPLKYRIWRASDDTEFEVSSVSYTCTLPGCRSDGAYKRDAIYEVSSLDASTALPVELTTFKATRRGESVVLNWRTASETNNSGFRVQHKEIGAGSWSTLSFVEGAGTTARPQTYQYEAEDLAYGSHQFRLAQVDRDGSRSTSKTVEVAFKLDSAYEISKVYPNPVRQTGEMKLTVKESQTVTVRLYDLLGREQGVLLDRSLSGDQTERVQLKTDQLTSGQYFIRVEGDGFQVTRRITVVK